MNAWDDLSDAARELMSGCLPGPADVKAAPFIAVSQEDVGDWSLSSIRTHPLPTPTPAPTLAVMADLAAAAREQHDTDRTRLEESLTSTATAAGLTVVRTDPVEQVAAHPASVAALRAEIDALIPRHELWAAGITRHSPFAGDHLAPGLYANLPLVPDDTLPPGEVHLRPHPRPADTTS